MDEYISKVAILKDALAATGQKLKETEIVLITLGGLGEDYESFVTANTTRFDPKLTLSGLDELLMVHEMQVEKSRSSILLVANIVVNSSALSPKSDVKCQICARKGHNFKDCYNRLNLTRFPTTLNGRTY